jgi:ubiquinone/menaquinone biosynthesis C-methylase UbiE
MARGLTERVREMGGLQNPFVPEYADAFDAHRMMSQATESEWVERVAGLMPTPSGAGVRLLDVGCGTGRFSIPFARRFPGATIVGIDSSRAMLRACAAKISEGRLRNVALEECDFLRWSVASEFDILFMSEVVHLFGEIRCPAQAAYQALAPGGDLLIRATCRDQLLRQEWHRYFPSSLALDSSRHRSQCELLAALTEAGFTGIVAEEVDESRWLSAPDYIRMHEEKAFSLHHLLPPAELARGLAVMKGELAGETRVAQVLEMTSMVAHRPT